MSARRKAAGNSQRLAKTGACRGFASKPAPFFNARRCSFLFPHFSQGGDCCALRATMIYYDLTSSILSFSRPRPARSHCENSGSCDVIGASARSGRAKQRSLLCPLSENLRPIPTEVPCGHFWRHLSMIKGGKNCSSQETPNRRCGMLPDIHSGCFRRFHTPILLKLTIVKDSLFDCGRRAAARSRPMRRAASFRHRRSMHSLPAAG